ncbi:hypothetical protein CEP54_009150 [Fusarium duplospermum]|uniref:Uncharacterized protein n=1 Tax=Fusarium duplospermum TaxID=1325734 RepID=A0A428PSB7_9HYPO|nr:hypothetical protein CEP54_009150 [Fusarium duplospermum]
MLRTPLRRNIASALTRAQTIPSLRTLQAPTQILLQQQRARIHQKTPDQQPQTQSKETGNNAQIPPKRSEPPKTQPKQKKDAKEAASKPGNRDKDDLEDIQDIILFQAIVDLIHDITHDFRD